MKLCSSSFNSFWALSSFLLRTDLFPLWLEFTFRSKACPSREMNFELTTCACPWPVTFSRATAGYFLAWGWMLELPMTGAESRCQLPPESCAWGHVEVLGLNQEPFRREECVLGRQPTLSSPVNILTISKVIFLLLLSLLFLKCKSNLGFLQGLKHSLVLYKFIPPNSTLWRPPQELLEARYHAWLF